jgi:putative ABC transport system substrate-binding protein
MNRRRFLQTLSASLLAAPVASEAQTSGKVALIGYLGNSTPTAGLELLEALRQGLRELGWTENQTITIESRWADGKVERLPAIAAELVRLKSNVIVVSGTSAARAAQQATKTIPIVVAAVLVDPVRTGLVASLARPGGNITGLASQYEDIVTKQVQLLTEAVPGLVRLSILRHASSLATERAAAAAAAATLGLKPQPLEVRNVAEFDGAFQAARDGRAQAIHVLPSPFLYAHRGLLIELAARYRLPAMYELGEYVREGGLMSYGVSLPEMFRRAASYIDRILKGAKPGDLPIERPARFELAINLKTAKALGLSIPPPLVSRADEVIQ